MRDGLLTPLILIIFLEGVVLGMVIALLIGVYA